MKRIAWIAGILLLALTGYFAFQDGHALWRWTTHYLRSTFDPVYVQSTWYGKKAPSPNYFSRRGQTPTSLIIHYTGRDYTEDALEWMSSPRSNVSAHYLINAYGTIYQFVPESFAAWHAGHSYWRGADNLNFNSIGIELVNSGIAHYTPAQMQKLAWLSKAIIKRYDIAPRNILAHSDISPQYKKDPGKLFDWRYMAEQGVGLYPKATNASRAPLLKRGDDGQKVLALQEKLARYGYDAPQTGLYDLLTEQVVLAFQRHFRQELVNGIWDADCEARLDQLLKMAHEEAGFSKTEMLKP